MGLDGPKRTAEQERERVYELPFEGSLTVVVQKLTQAVSSDLETQVKVIQQCAAETRLYDEAISNALERIADETDFTKVLVDKRQAIENDPSLSDEMKEQKLLRLRFTVAAPPAMNIHDLRNSFMATINGRLSVCARSIEYYREPRSYPELDTLEKQLYVAFHADESEISEEDIQSVSRSEIEKLVKQTIVQFVLKIEQSIKKLKKNPFLGADKMSDKEYAYAIRVLNEEFAKLKEEQKSE